MSVGASCSCNKWQQATTTSPIAMGATKAITNCYGCDQCLHCDAPKCLHEEPLKCNAEGHGDQPWSHKAALSTNTTRVLWERCEYHDDTHPTTMIIAARASIATMHVQWMKTAMFCWPAQESRVVCLTQQRQLLSLPAWPTGAAQAPWWQRLRRRQAQQQEESPQVQGQGLQALPPTWQAPQ